MSSLVNIAREGRTSIVTLVNPPVNVLSRALAAALSAAWNEFNENEDLETLVLTGSGKTFIAGADIREIERITLRDMDPGLGYLNTLLNKIECGPKPTVMAINGTALGIGLETAMAGHYRILKAGSVIGQPEVKLGLIPGAGGTQRLPRLTGVDTALKICVHGEPIDASDVEGIMDEVTDGDVVERALAVAANLPLRRTCDLPCGPWTGFEVASQRRAPHRAALAIHAATQSATFAQGLATEEELFRECLLDGEARELVQAFFAKRAAAKAP